MNNKPNLLELLDASQKLGDGHYGYVITDNWMQGRTTYGGLSACLCLDAVYKEYSDLPPLRSAQITFVGPVNGEVSVKIEVLRRGKSVANVHARLSNEHGIGTEVVFTFGASRQSRLDADYTEQVKLVAPEDAAPFFGPHGRPVFTENFDCRLVEGDRPMSGSSKHDMLMWVRYNEDGMSTGERTNPYSSLLAIADMPPPAVLPMFEEFAPISSMTWMVNFLDEPTNSDSDWWLLRSTAENAKDGYSSQNMLVWDANGRLVVTGRQSVAVFY